MRIDNKIMAVAYLLMSAVLLFYYCSIPPSPDQSIFDYMAWLAANGAPHYSGAFDMTWPGQLIVHDIGLALFGVHPWTSRATDFLYLQLGVFGLWMFARNSGRKRAATLILFTYPLMYVTSGGWMAGHRDITGMHLLIVSAALLTSGRPFLAGLAQGYAVATRPTYLLFMAWSGLDEVMKSRIRPALALSAGLSCVVVFFVALGAITGTIGDWWAQGVEFVVDVYPVAESRARLPGLFVKAVSENWSWLAATALIGAALWLFEDRASRPVRLFFGLAVTAIISFVVQNKGFAYHLGGLIPLMVLATCIGVDIAIGRPQKIHRIGAVALVGLFALGLTMRASNAIRHFQPNKADRIASIIRAESSPGEKAMQFGWDYDVMFQAQRPSPTKYINAPAMGLIKNEDIEYRIWLDRFAADLTKTRFLLIGRKMRPSLAREIVLAKARTCSVRDRSEDTILFRC